MLPAKPGPCSGVADGEGDWAGSVLEQGVTMQPQQRSGWLCPRHWLSLWGEMCLLRGQAKQSCVGGGCQARLSPRSGQGMLHSWGGVLDAGC